MALNATSFIKNRKKIISISNDRIKNILWYIIECYGLLQKDKRIYSKLYIKSNTSHKFEDYLKIELVDKYLIAKKAMLQSRVSALEEINFSYETQKRYIDSKDGKEKSDKIDIYINKIGLQNEWKDHDEHIYFALECKRINGTSSYNQYLLDIKKFTDRNHTNLRLPFEGMIGFIEKKILDHKIVSNQVSNRLKISTFITTTQYLTSILLNSTFSGSYVSSHRKGFGKKDIFQIYHLLFDYSKNVTT